MNDCAPQLFTENKPRYQQLKDLLLQEIITSFSSQVTGFILSVI